MSIHTSSFYSRTNKKFMEITDARIQGVEAISFLPQQSSSKNIVLNF